MAETVTPRPLNYAALKTEILLPAYNGMTDAQIIAAVNAKTMAPVGGAKLTITTAKIFNALDATEFQALTQLQLTQLQVLMAQGTVDASAGTFARTLLLALFPSGTRPITRAALVALAAAADAATVSWVQAMLSTSAVTIAAIVQADLDNARAS